MALICYVNGVFCAAEEARVSAFDHGFLYGDGIFYTADEAFVTSSFSRVHPVAEVDGRPIPCPGALTVRLRAQLATLAQTEGEPVG